jgi:hypothetical protein
MAFKGKRNKQKPGTVGASHTCLTSKGEPLFTVTFAGGELILGWSRSAHEVAPAEREWAADWLKRLLPHKTHDQRYAFLWE